MLDVHGIAVAGGTFPAEIWHDFMSSASPGSRDFPVSNVEPSWNYGYRGQYQYEGGYYDPYGSSSSSSQQESTTTSTTTIQPPTTTTPQQEQPPPPTHTTPQRTTPVSTTPVEPVTPPKRHEPPPTD